MGGLGKMKQPKYITMDIGTPSLTLNLRKHTTVYQPLPMKLQISTERPMIQDANYYNSSEVSTLGLMTLFRPRFSPCRGFVGSISIGASLSNSS